MDLDNVDELTEQVIGAAITVHTALGPGLLESLYRECLGIELQHRNIPFAVEVRFPVIYREIAIRDSLRVDMLVDRRLVVEIKAVERIHPVHKAQVITYLKISTCPAGLLLNFNATSIRRGLYRLDRPDIYAWKVTARKKAY